MPNPVAAPKSGSPAFTVLNGLLFEGILQEVPDGGGWVIIPANGQSAFSNAEGCHKRYRNMAVANVLVYAPSRYNLSEPENDFALKEFGRGLPDNRIVEFDGNRRKWYLRAYKC